MAETSPKPSLEDALAESLDTIDRMLAQAGIPLHTRPMTAATKLVDLCIVAVDTGDGAEQPPGKMSDYVTTKWFKIIYKATEEWYRHRYGEAMDASRSDGRDGTTLIRDTPYLLKIPMTTNEPGEPGESFWLCYHDAVEPYEDPLEWVRHGPILANLEPKDVKSARALAKEVATKLRATHIALMGMDASDARVLELREGIFPNLQRAARHLVKGSVEDIKLAHWDMQMACELALKCLAQQRAGAFKETHDLFYLFDNMPDSAPPFKRSELSKLPNWERMAELRYGGGQPISVRSAFRAYRATLEIVSATTDAFKKLYRLGKAKFHLKRPPWMEDI